MMKSVLFLTALVFGTAFSASLPPFIKKCKVGADLDKCVITSANAAIARFAKGDEKYRIPSTDPIHVRELSVKENAGSVAVNLKFNDVYITGLANSKLVNSRMDLDKKLIEWTFEVPKVVMDSQYKIDGRILILPITGNGKGHIELENVKLKFTLSYKLMTVKGREVVKIEKIDAKHFTQKLKLNFENLFNGDKALGDNMNVILNDSWEELNKQLGPPLIQSIALYVQANLNRFLSQIPYSEIFEFQ